MERVSVISVAALLASAALLSTPAASAKDFHPGDVRVCNQSRCVPITEAGALDVLSSFIYGSRKPVLLGPVRLGARSYQLRFRNGYAIGAVATARLDHFRSYGVICGRFRRGKWYRLPVGVVRELRRLTAGLEPMAVGRTPRSC